MSRYQVLYTAPDGEARLLEHDSFAVACGEDAFRRGEMLRGKAPGPVELRESGKRLSFVAAAE